ncbi:dTDP-4-dehydrorhamnose reductase [Candidatus Dependentiae bacterium]|nr:dTDP-4-dehydrorhamnose reductase [Candidatus Dependentiae bacterium]
MNILVTGANGMLGSSLKEESHNYKNFKVYFTDVKKIDITDKDQVSRFIEDYQIKAIINCAAYTNVDACEKNSDLAKQINAEGPGVLAEVCRKYFIKLCHISTDYVYSSSILEPLDETAQLKPLSVYGKTKLLGENKICDKMDRYFILRAAWMFGCYGENFFKWVYNTVKNKNQIKLIIDHYGNPTYSNTLANIIFHIIKTDKFGIYNASNNGYTNWYNFGKHIIDSADLEANIKKITGAELKLPAKRPQFSVMNINKLISTFHINIELWQDAVVECLKRYRKMYEQRHQSN